MPHLRALPVTVVGLFLFTAGASAQEVPSPYRFVEPAQEAGPLVGYMDMDTGRFGLGPKSAVFYGGSYAVHVGGPVALEGAVLVVPTERDVVNPRRVEGDRVLPDPAEVTLLNISARLRFNLTGRRTWNSLQPFALAGAGVMFDIQGDQAEDQRLEEDERYDFGTGFAGIFGGGVRWLIADNFSLRGEAGISLYQVDVPEGWRDPSLGLEGVPESEWVNAGTYSLGVTLLF